jgi:hypothetical protein
MKLSHYTLPVCCWLFLFFQGSNAFACECWTNKDVSVEDLWKNDVIFKGQILSVKSTSINGRSLQKALFRIDQMILSKNNYDTISIYTPETTESCGLSFKQNSIWLIFANGNNFYESTQCSHAIEQRNDETKKQIAGTLGYLSRLSSGGHSINENIDGHDGRYTVIGEIVNGKLHGRWFKVAGRDTLSSLNFYYGKQIGYQSDRSRSGRIEERTISYINGDKIESVKFYSTHGGDMLMAKYKNGILHGSYESKFSDTYKTGEFTDGKESGEWLIYIHGMLVSRKVYVDG